MRRSSIRSIVVAALAALLVCAVPASASQAGDTEHGVNRKKLANKALKLVETRNGIDVLKISRCGPQKKKQGLNFSKWVCEWRAAGEYAGDVPYSCAGKAVWKRKKNRWRVDKCQNQMQPQVPLLDTPGPAPAFGYNDNWIFQSNTALDKANAGGAQIARTSLAWSGVEGQQGSYNWYGSDALYNKLLERGMRPLWVIIDAPCWAQPNPGACESGDSQLHPAKQHTDDFAQFAAIAAKRYPKSAGIEIWNEPNYPLFWGGWPDVDQYAKMLSASADAVHQAQPGMPVVSGGLSPHADSDKSAIGFSNYLDDLYKRGAIQKADAIGIHPYPGVGPSQDYFSDVRVYLGKVQNVMQAHGDGSRPLWATEFGVSTTGDKAFAPSAQGDALVQLYTLLRSAAGMNIPVAVIHRFVEAPGLGGREAGFGMVNKDLSVKPAYCAMSAARGADPSSC